MFVSMTAMVGSGFSRRIDRIESIDNYGAVYGKLDFSDRLSLANEMQQPNGKLDYFLIEYKNFPFDKSTESIESTKGFKVMGSYYNGTGYFSKPHK